MRCIIPVGFSRRRNSAMDSPGAKQRVRKSAAIFATFCALCCGMFHLEYRVDQEAFRVAVVAAKGQHFADDAAAGLALDMHHEIDGFCNFGFGVGESRLRVVAHDQIGEAMQRLLGRIGMDRRERSGVASVEGIEQRARLDSAYFAQDDAVRPPSESGLEKVVESDVRFERIRLAFDRQYVRLLDLEFRSIFDNDEAFIIRNEISQYPQKGRLSGTRSATDKQRLSAANLLRQEVRKRAR